MDEERLRRRASFDQDPAGYATGRPGYPSGVFDAVAEYAGLRPGHRALEIGCGPGHATVPIARRGVRIDAIELGERMAAEARRRTQGLPVTVRTGAFEETPIEEGVYDLALAASSFHWLEPSVRMWKIAAALRPGGALALIWTKHVRARADSGFFDEAQAVYAREAPGIRRDFAALPEAEGVPEPFREEIEATGLFADVAVRRFRWDRWYTTKEYVDLLATYSDHRALEPGALRRLLLGVTDLIKTRFGGRVLRGHLTLLYLARRR
ncbi:MAG TPA: class I SAM-dependent methyltransferase [Chthonomonadales bacterium]|nr:class I SAM-dependent methyltransferase [Chthonomonadales bacterium]